MKGGGHGQAVYGNGYWVFCMAKETGDTAQGVRNVLDLHHLCGGIKVIEVQP
jgi:hypothetical protein